MAYVWRVRTEPDEKIAPQGDRFSRTALGVVLTGTALLAPLYQAHLHTDISFLKNSCPSRYQRICSSLAWRRSTITV